MYCRKCGTRLPSGAVECNSCGTPAAKRPAGSVCAVCGHVAASPARFCRNCGATLQERDRPSGPTGPLTAVPPPSSPAVPSQSTEPLTHANPCPHCGAPVRVGAKFCRSCGKPPSTMLPRAAPPPLSARGTRDVPSVARVSPSLGTARLHPHAGLSRKGRLVWVAGLSMFVLVSGAIGYVKIHKPVLSDRGNKELPEAGGSANSVALQPAPTGRAPQPSAPPGSEPASGPPAQTQGSVHFVGKSSRAAVTVQNPQRTAEAQLPAPAVPAYQQAHANAEQALAAERYIDPPDDCALFWARKARQQGDPGMDQIEQQVLDKEVATVQVARAAQNYDLATTLLTKLKTLFPDHPELEQMTLMIQQEQQEHAKPPERQLQKVEPQMQTKQFLLRHRHMVGVQGFKPLYSYCEGFLSIAANGTARFDCTRTADPRGRCDHVALNPGDIKEVRPNRDGSIHLVTASSGNLDFYGDPSAIQGATDALRAVVRR
jgi:ribosomal protein L40E